MTLPPDSKKPPSRNVHLTGKMLNNMVDDPEKQSPFWSGISEILEWTFKGLILFFLLRLLFPSLEPAVRSIPSLFSSTPDSKTPVTKPK